MISAPYHADCYVATIILRVFTVALSMCGSVVLGVLLAAQDRLIQTRETSGDISKAFPVVLLVFCIYGFFWSIIIRFVRMSNGSSRIHPAVFMTFDLIAGGVILGLSVASLSNLDTKYADGLSCGYYYSTCDVDRAKSVEKTGCIIGIVDSSFFLILSAWWATVCVGTKSKRREILMYPDRDYY